MSADRDNYVEVNNRSNTNQPGANSDLLIVEHDAVDVRAAELIFTATAANFFDVVERDQDGSNEVIIRSYRLSGDGQIRISESFDEPEFTLGTDREIVLRNRTNDSSGDVSVSYKAFEKRE